MFDYLVVLACVSLLLIVHDIVKSIGDQSCTTRRKTKTYLFNFYALVLFCSCKLGNVNELSESSLSVCQ